jgi:hydrogenase-4 component B
MSVVLAGVCLIVMTGICCLFVKNTKLSLRIGSAGVFIGSIPALVASIAVLSGIKAMSLIIPWQVPFGSLNVGIDCVTALFLLPIIIVSSVASIYGCEYMSVYKNRRIGVPVFFFNMLAAGMMMVVMARNGVLFLLAWEVMSLASYFLVTFDDENDSVQTAGWIYLIATHIGTAFLFAFFILLGKYGGSMNFDDLTILKSVTPAAASILFMLSLVGFGTKAGIMPLHIWLPEAHPAAPSHVSAVMSGVMIKTGIYGIVRTLMLLPAPPLWWGWLLVGIGAVSGVFGVLLALAQHDLKRLLAYHSVENIGIIILGLGIGTLGLSSSSNILTITGFGGALLHVINHAFFKGLLFFGAGAVAHTTGTRNIDTLGGLVKKMPFTAGAFVIGAIAICGIPPLNGFISEFMVYYGAFTGTIEGKSGIIIPALIVIGSLALIGGLALACFTKVFGFIFLGQARSKGASCANEVGFAMQFAMWTLAAGCVVIGLAAPFIISPIVNVITQISGSTDISSSIPLDSIKSVLFYIVLVSVLLVVVMAGISLLRNRLLPASKISRAVTWDCGYACPTERMQYTASSFAQPLLLLFSKILRPHSKAEMTVGLFPKKASFSTHTPDVSQEHFFKPIFLKVAELCTKLRFLQQGSVQLYILYIALTLLFLLIWKLW